MSNPVFIFKHSTTRLQSVIRTSEMQARLTALSDINHQLNAMQRWPYIVLT